jgi:carbon starvation protein
MSLLSIIVIAGACFLIAYRFYGRLLARLLRLDPEAKTPAVEMRDDVDYMPIEPKFLLGQHFSAIAAAGPIVGPILAGLYFGWLPALIWIVVGAIFIGGVHDTTSLLASVRHKARSIAEVVRDHMTRRAHLLFLSFIWIALVYIIVAFADITASSFVGKQTLENGKVVNGGGIATASLLYLLLPIAMGLLMRFTKLSLGWVTVIFLPLVGFVIWLGQSIPFELASLLGASDDVARKIWVVAILLYCMLAAVLPMWLLLQPRGHLGGYFLYFGLLVGILGITFSGNTAQYPAFTGWETAKGDMLVPILFITIACGACSGFHSLIASGTTSKQLRRETDAKLIGYGTMLMEGMVAVISLSCVMMLAKNAPILQNPKPNFIFAAGIGSYLEMAHIPATFAVSIMLMAFTTFVYDTLDVCTRLGRYIIQELTGWHNSLGRWLGTALTAGVPLLFVMQKTVDMTGKPIPAWQLFWSLFGASNQLLAALTLLGVTVWLWRTYRARWVWFVTGLPTVWMYVMSVWALMSMVIRAFMGGSYANPVPWVALILVGLAVLMLLEAVRVFMGTRSSPPQPEPVAVS